MYGKGTKGNHFPGHVPFTGCSGGVPASPILPNLFCPFNTLRDFANMPSHLLATLLPPNGGIRSKRGFLKRASPHFLSIHHSYFVIQQ